MGIIQRIKEGISRYVKPRPKANEQVEYVAVRDNKTGKMISDTTTTRSDQPVRRSIDEKNNERMEKINEHTRHVVGPSEGTLITRRERMAKPDESRQRLVGEHVAPTPSSGGRVTQFISRVKEAVATSKMRGLKARAIRRGEAREKVEKSQKSFAGRTFIAAQQAPQQLIAKTSGYTGKAITEKGISKKEAIRLVRKDIGIIGNPVMMAFAGVPERKFEKEREPKGKKTLYGRKISKKEEKELRKKYGRNWRMALRQDRQRRLYTQVTPFQKAQIKRENRLDQVSVNFGDQFPEPSQFLSSEYSRQPFARRTDDPFDVEAMFMGERGSGLTKKYRDPFAVGHEFGGGLDIGIKGLSGKKRDPFTVNTRLKL